MAFHSQRRSHSLANSFATLNSQLFLGVLVSKIPYRIGRQKVGYGMVVDGFAKFQALNFGISGSEISEGFFFLPSKQGILLDISGPENEK